MSDLQPSPQAGSCARKRIKGCLTSKTDSNKPSPRALSLYLLGCSTQGKACHNATSHPIECGVFIYLLTLVSCMNYISRQHFCLRGCIDLCNSACKYGENLVKIKDFLICGCICPPNHNYTIPSPLLCDDLSAMCKKTLYHDQQASCDEQRWEKARHSRLAKTKEQQ